jgi:predicted nuclease of predicted toxin-antitoxin system
MATTPNFNLNYPIGTDSIAVPTDLQNLATDTDTKLLASNNRAVGTLLVAKDYDPTFIVEVVNTTTPTNIVSLSLANVIAGEVYELNWFGRYLNNSGTNRQATLTVSLGATSFFATGNTTGNIPTATTERAMMGTVRLYVDTLNSQLCMAQWQNSGTTANHPTAAMLLLNNVYGSASEDLSSAKNLTLTFNHSVAGTTTRLRVLGYTLVRLRA